MCYCENKYEMYDFQYEMCDMFVRKLVTLLICM